MHLFATLARLVHYIPIIMRNHRDRAACAGNPAKPTPPLPTQQLSLTTLVRSSAHLARHRHHHLLSRRSPLFPRVSPATPTTTYRHHADQVRCSTSLSAASAASAPSEIDADRSFAESAHLPARRLSSTLSRSTRCVLVLEHVFCRYRNRMLRRKVASAGGEGVYGELGS